MSSTGKGGKTQSVLGGLPQVNLLPPEVRAARGLKVIRRWLMVGLVVVALALAGVYVLTLTARGAAEAERAEAQEDTVALQAEQERYAEVPLVLAALTEAELARLIGMSTEVEWSPYFDAITAVLPPGVSLETIAMSGATPVMLPAPPASPLMSPSVGQLQFTGRSLTVPDTAAWMNALESIPGFSDAWVTTTQLTDEAGDVFYSVTSTVQVDQQAYSGRFAPTEEED